MQFQSFCFFWFTFLFELRHEMVCNLLIQGFKGVWPNTTTISLMSSQYLFSFS